MVLRPEEVFDEAMAGNKYLRHRLVTCTVGQSILSIPTRPPTYTCHIERELTIASMAARVSAKLSCLKRLSFITYLQP
jgi:hypothetical protein